MDLREKRKHSPHAGAQSTDQPISRLVPKPAWLSDRSRKEEDWWRKNPTWPPVWDFVLVSGKWQKQRLVFECLGPELPLKQEWGFCPHQELFILQVTASSRILFTKNMRRGSRKSKTRSRREDCKFTLYPFISKIVQWILLTDCRTFLLMSLLRIS